MKHRNRYHGPSKRVLAKRKSRKRKKRGKRTAPQLKFR